MFLIKLIKKYLTSNYMRYCK